MPVGGLASDVRAVVGVVLGAAVVAVVEARRGAVVVVSSLVPMADVVVVVSSTGAVVVVVSGSVDVVVPALTANCFGSESSDPSAIAATAATTRAAAIAPITEGLRHQGTPSTVSYQAGLVPEMYSGYGGSLSTFLTL